MESRKKFQGNEETPWEKNKKTLEAIEKRNDYERDKEVASGAGFGKNKVEAIQRAFIHDFPDLVQDQDSFGVVVEKINERLANGEENIYSTYEAAGRETMEELTGVPLENEEDKMRREAIEEDIKLRGGGREL